MKADASNALAELAAETERLGLYDAEFDMHDGDPSDNQDTVRIPSEVAERLRRATIRPPALPVLCRLCIEEMLHDGVAMTYECLGCGAVVAEQST